jgi:hypothetical protein
MSLHHDDGLDDLPSFEKTRKRRRAHPARNGQRNRMCTGKKRYHNQDHAKQCGRIYGYSTYYCWLCNGWHLTKREME